MSLPSRQESRDPDTMTLVGGGGGVGVGGASGGGAAAQVGELGSWEQDGA